MKRAISFSVLLLLAIVLMLVHSPQTTLGQAGRATAIRTNTADPPVCVAGAEIYGNVGGTLGVLKYCNSAGQFVSIVANSNPSVAQQIDSFFGMMNGRVFRYIVANPSGSFGTAGENTTETGATNCNGGSTAATASAPFMCPDGTGSTINTPAGVSAAVAVNAQIHRTGRTNGIIQQVAGSITPITNIRMFRGLTDLSGANMVQQGGGAGTDATIGNYAGFMFSTTGAYTGLSDTTHFVCVTSDNSAQNAVNSTITADTAFHKFEIIEQIGSPTKWHFYIDGAEVCGTGISTHPPNTGINLRYANAILNLAASNNTINTAWVVTTDDL